MILYYTGTGNSRYCADYIGNRIGDDVICLFDKIKNSDFSEIRSISPFVVVTPTYSWQIPHILRNWLINTKLTGCDKIYFVMTCGGEIGNAEKYLRALCEEISMQYMGCAEVVMPENYIAMFDAPNDDTAKEIIKNSEVKLAGVADRILNENALPPVKTNAIGRIYSSIVNKIFYSVFVKDKKFTVSDKCIGCGTCESRCIMNNIKLIDGKPTWNGNCTHCMACISYCPKEAIEYGSHSKGLNRYTCPEYK